MSNKLTVSRIKEVNKKYKAFIELPVYLEEEEYIIKIYPFFKPEKVKKMVDDMILFYQAAKKENISISSDYDSDITAYFIVRAFTDLKFTTSKKAKVIFDEIKEVINAPKVFEVVLKGFPEESIKEIYSRVHDVIAASKKVSVKSNELAAEYNNVKLENDFIKTSPVLAKERVE